MDKIVAELKKVLPLKPTTHVGDIVIIAAEDPQMLVYAMVCAIERDESRKEEWWHVTFKFLGVPLQTVTWTLRTPQFSGGEVFTMGGAGRFIQAVDLGVHSEQEGSVKSPQSTVSKAKGLRIVK